MSERASSPLKEGLTIVYVPAATLDHPGLFLGNGVCESRAVARGPPRVARAVVHPDLNVVGRRREWLRIAHAAKLPS